MPIIDKSVLYRESPNNFTMTQQFIQGEQIVSIKIFKGPGPDASPDFLGQLGLSVNLDGGSKLWVSRIFNGALDWDVVGTDSQAVLPDYVVRENSDNEFSVYEQSIQGAQIVAVTSGPHSPDNEPIKGPGHMYIKNSDITPEVYMAHTTSSGLQWIRFADHQILDTVVYKDLSNDFSDANQTIMGTPIASIASSILDPVLSKIEPGRPGEIWVQLGKATENKLPRMWIAKDMNIPGVPHWEEISSSSGGVPANVALTSSSNNFTVAQQEINGKQILSFVDGGDKTPEQSKLPADYDGQFYIAVRGDDPAIWIAKGNKWIPLLANVAMTNRVNRFVPLQEMGLGDRVVRITGASQGTVNPLTVGLVPLTDGEIYIQTIEHPYGGFDRHVWVAAEGGDTTSWLNVYDDKDHTIVRTDEVNHFTTKTQYLGIESDHSKELIVGARQYLDHSGSDSPNNYTPQRTGEIIVLREEEQGEFYWVTYMSIVHGNKKAWTELSHVLIP